MIIVIISCRDMMMVPPSSYPARYDCNNGGFIYYMFFTMTMMIIMNMVIIMIVLIVETVTQVAVEDTSAGSHVEADGVTSKLE